MKNLLVLSLLFVFLACTERDEVPAAVLEAFTASHPNVTDVDWEPEDDGTYEVEFEFQDAEFAERYRADGQLIESATELDEQQLPVAVMQSIARQYPDYEIEDVDQLTSADGRISYRIELEGDDLEMDVIFNADGSLVDVQAEED